MGEELDGWAWFRAGLFGWAWRGMGTARSSAMVDKMEVQKDRRCLMGLREGQKQQEKAEELMD
jgi:hypothetical protein